MKKLVFLITFVLLHICGCTSSSSLQGNGTEENPYLIRNGNDLSKLSAFVANKKEQYVNGHYKVTNDINLKNVNFLPIGGIDFSYFNGTFDGDGHTIKNFKISAYRQYSGLFGYLEKDATIKNLNVETNYSIVSQRSFTGLVVSFASAGSKILNCSAKGSIIYDKIIDQSSFSNSKFISQYKDVLVEETLDEEESEEEKTKTVYYFKGFAGGIVGMNYGLVENCSASVTIKSDVVGGIAGSNAGTITNCEAVNCNLYAGTSVGGIVGYSNLVINSSTEYAQVTYCSSRDHHISGTTILGGIVGASLGRLIIDRCQSYGIIEDTSSHSTTAGDILGRIVYLYVHASSQSNLYLNNRLNNVKVTNCLSLNSFKVCPDAEKYLSIYVLLFPTSFASKSFSDCISQMSVKDGTSSNTEITSSDLVTLYVFNENYAELANNASSHSDLTKETISERIKTPVDNIETHTVDDVTGYILADVKNVV